MLKTMWTMYMHLLTLLPSPLFALGGVVDTLVMMVFLVTCVMHVFVIYASRRGDMNACLALHCCTSCCAPL